MEKNFDKWNMKKKQVDGSTSVRSFHEREIWFIKIGENVGFEQCGKGDEFLRPVIVYKKFSGNLFLGIPLTRTKRSGRFYATFDFKGKESTAIVSQIRLFDAKRLTYKTGKMSMGDYTLIQKKLIALLR